MAPSHPLNTASSPLSAALRPIQTMIPETSSSNQRLPTFQRAATGSGTNTSAAENDMGPIMRLRAPVVARNLVLDWWDRTFGDTRTAAAIQEFCASTRRAFFGDVVMESVVFIVMAEQQDGVLLPRVGFTDRVLRSAYCSAIQWYLDVRGSPFEFEEVVSQNNGLPMECLQFNIPVGGQAVRSIDHDASFGAPVIVRTGRHNLRRALQAILLTITLIYLLVVPSFARYLVDTLLCEEYHRVVKATASYTRWSINCVELPLRFAYSVFFRVARRGS